MTALTIAVSSNNLAVAKLLLNNGANRDLRTIKGLTALDIAKTNNNVTMVDLLGSTAR